MWKNSNRWLAGLIMAAIPITAALLITDAMKEESIRKEQKRIKEAEEHTRDSLRAIYLVKDRMDTMLVINKDKEFMHSRYDFYERERLELATPDGTHVAHIVQGVDNRAAVRAAQRGDKMVVKTSQTADSVYNYQIMRNLTADKLVQEFAKQK